MIDKATLRALIRDVIATEVAAAKAGGGQAASPTPGDDRTARIASDADLNAFAKRVLALAADAGVQQSIAAGTYGFRLEGGASGHSASSGASAQVSGSTLRINDGVVTETMLNRLAKGITKIQLAPGVSLTPLAKDRVRSLNLTIERTKK
jgi:hypothetical protein